jgi:predicted AAA+ superfamily ATPase
MGLAVGEGRHMTYTHRLLERRCAKTLAEGKILVLVGARQTGKSTLVSHLLADVPEQEKLFLNMDDQFLRDRLVSVEGALLAALEAKARRPLGRVERFHLVVDEAQKAPALFEMIKLLADQHPDRLRIVLTGSSVLALHDPVAESLAGRVRIQQLHPFTLCEAYSHATGDALPQGLLPEAMSALLAGKFGPEHAQALAERARFQRAEREAWMRERIHRPLFPEPAGQADPEEWIRDYLATYLEKDIHALSAVGNVTLFRACLRQLAAHTGNPVKWERMAQRVGTTSVTFRKYAGLMEQTLNLVRLPAFAVNPVARVVRAPKLYLVDQGLMWGLRGYEDRALLEATGMIGAYMELAAVAELAKWCSLETTAPELRYWSKTAVSEVDVVVSNRGFHIPFEIKLSTRLERSWLRGLEAFEADHQRQGLHIPYRVLLYMGDPAVVDDRTFAIPLWALT